MITLIEKIGSYMYGEIVIEKAASIIKNGGLVAFPTETVYGLGANGLNEDAAGKIYAAKGRPLDNPLILHIDNFKWIGVLASEVSGYAKAAIEAFWPGPLTVILKKTPLVPDGITGGLPTVAIRMPQNDIAIKLIRKSGVPIAAPSANSSGKPSPTRASHVAYDLSGKIDMIIDGGSCKYGIESTIADFTKPVPVILRPGHITKTDLEEAAGCVFEEKTMPHDDDDPPEAPGMKYKHYAPAARITVVCGEPGKVVGKINELVLNAKDKGQKPGVLSTDQSRRFYKCDFVLSLGDKNDSESIGRNLFKMLRKFDYYGIDVVFAEGYPGDTDAGAVMNRLIKASGNNIIFVQDTDD